MKKIEKLDTAAPAFSPLAEKINEILEKNPPLEAGFAIKIDLSNERTLISLNLTAANLEQILTGAKAVRSFYCVGSDADVKVSAGAINNVYCAASTVTTPADNSKIYIDATISGYIVTTVSIGNAASVPSNTSTHVYKLISTVTVASGSASAIPVGWNFSEMQLCAGSALWGGFGT